MPRSWLNFPLACVDIAISGVFPSRGNSCLNVLCSLPSPRGPLLLRLYPPVVIIMVCFLSLVKLVTCRLRRLNGTFMLSSMIIILVKCMVCRLLVMDSPLIPLPTWVPPCTFVALKTCTGAFTKLVRMSTELWATLVLGLASRWLLLTTPPTRADPFVPGCLTIVSRSGCRVSGC